MVRFKKKEREKIMNKVCDLYEELLLKATDQTSHLGKNGKYIHVSIEAINDRFEFLLRERLESEGFKPTLVDWAIKELARSIARQNS